MSSQRDNILEFNQYRKSDKMPYIFYAHIESLIKKIGGFTNNQEDLSIAKISEHIPCKYLISKIWASKNTLYIEEKIV